jgi:hypothetical protein
LSWSSASQSLGVIDVKGIEGATRRDSVPIIAKIMSEIMDLLFPLDKNNAGIKTITNEERKEIIEKVQKVVKISVRKILSGELDIGEFIMTRVPNLISSAELRGYGLERHQKTTRESKHISLLWIRLESEIQEEYSKTVNGTAL